MDEMRIQSKMLTGLISKFIENVLRRRFGIICDVKIHEITIKNDSGKTEIKLNIEGDAETSNIHSFLKRSLNLD